MSNRSAIASMSLGRAWVHDMGEKLAQAARVGFEGVEIFYEDVEYLAKKHGNVDESSLLQAASEIRTTCDELGLAIVGLQPFLFYEGLIDRDEHQRRIEKLKVWFKLAKTLRTDIIQIPANFQPDGISGDLDLIVSDMIEIADLGSAEDPPIRFAYENLCWSRFINTWERLWEVIRRVDRPNFGCCLDTFNIAGGVWADPASPTGMTPNADVQLKQSMQRMIDTVDVSKVFFIQVVDAERLERPLIEGHSFYVEDQPARMSWSRNCRLFLYEQELGAYMPVVEIVRVLIKELGFNGWVSMELFNRSMSDPDPSVPQTHAERGFKAWERLASELEL